jgi:Tol biopolymer transport system component
MRAPSRFGVALLGAAVAAVVAVPVPAAADVFGSISLASAGTTPGSSFAQQSNYAHDPAISGNGRYVAFDGSFGGVTGVWRRDLLSGVVEEVAGGDAELPSISEDGRYVSFTTNEGRALARFTNGRANAPEEEAVNVYVRDMSLGPGEGGAFTLASAPSGSEEPLTYAAASTTQGSVASGRSALSGDGRKVAFVTTAASDLTDPQTPSEPTTPAMQVAVRNLDSRETKLVSVNRETGGPVSGTEGSETYGAVFGGLGGPLAFGPTPPYAEYGKAPPPGASISADGTAVAWMGANIGEQAPMLPAENRSVDYTEPLWRRIAPGSETPTERVTGGSDPQSPACVASGEGRLPETPSPSDPCQGPFAAASETPKPSGVLAGGTKEEFVPRLSADGYTVAFLSEIPPVSLSEFFTNTGQASDLYVVSMRPGLTRDAALTPITELASREGGISTTGSIFDFNISPDGSQVAFTSRRTQFTLGSIAFVSTRAGEPGMEELFDADLRNHTLTRTTQGFEGGASEHPAFAGRVVGQDPYPEGDGALSPSFSTSGDLIAFSSTASNLAYGDGNTPSNPKEGIGTPEDGGDAFVVERKAFAPLPTPQYVSPAAEQPEVPVWQIGVSALSRRDGTVLLYVRTPAAGTLRASARSAVLVRSGGSVHGARRAHARRAAHARAGARGRAKLTVSVRTVASRRTQAQGGGLVTMVLKLAGPYGPLASARGGLSSTVTVTFAAGGQRTIGQSVPVMFVRTTKASGRSVRVKGRAGRRR